jgi:hypothetical protein
MPVVSVNWWAILLAALANMFIGYVWYSNLLFAKPWMKAVGIKESDLKQGPGPGYLLTFLGAMLTAYVLTHIVTYTNSLTVFEGLKTGFWVWLGFVVPAFGAEYIFSKRTLNHYLITVGYHALALMAAGAIVVVVARA